MSSTPEDPLRAALTWLIDNSNPMHTTTCAGQDDDAPCICGVSERYEEVLALAAPPVVPEDPLRTLRPLFAEYEEADMARRVGKGDKAANLSRYIDAERAIEGAVWEAIEWLESGRTDRAEGDAVVSSRLRAALAAPPVAGAEVEAAWEALLAEFDREHAHTDMMLYWQPIVASHRPIIEAALRSAAPTLDVERLTDVLADWTIPELDRLVEPEAARHYAAAIAREYAALEGAPASGCPCGGACHNGHTPTCSDDCRGANVSHE